MRPLPHTVLPKFFYRPEIDGLRAVAVLAVVFYHAQVPGFGGGNVGVDIFFVISGYLITTFITTDLSKNRFSIVDFYTRRARRILPALLLVLSACTIIAWQFLIPPQLQAFSSALVSGIFFSVNMLLYLRSNDYFGTMTDTNPLLHLWSLGVEEQFYLAYPLFIIIIWRYVTRNLMIALIAAAMLSLLAAIVVAHKDQAAAFYLLPTRAWEILVGAIVALRAASSHSTERPNKITHILVYLGFAFLLAPIFVLNEAVGFPWPWALPSVIGTALILALANSAHPVTHILSLGPLRHIGLISYSAYLWHFPLLAFSWTLALSAPNLLARAGIVILTFILADLTWRLIEQPMRSRDRVKDVSFYTIIGSISILLTAAGVVGWISRGAPQRIPKHYSAMLRDAEKDKEFIDSCSDRQCVIGKSGPISIALFGDSHASMVSPALRAIADAAHFRALMVAYGGCPPVTIPMKLPGTVVNCEGKNRERLAQIARDSRIRTVIIAARWSFYFERTPFEDPEVGVDHRPRNAAVTAEMNATLRPAIRQTVFSLLQAGKHVLLVYPVPEAGFNVVNQKLKSWTIGKANAPLSVSFAAFSQRSLNSYDALDDVGTHPKLTRIYPARRLCNTILRNRCILAEKNRVYYFDDNHLTKEGALIAYADLKTALSSKSD